MIEFIAAFFTVGIFAALGFLTILAFIWGDNEEFFSVQLVITGVILLLFTLFHAGFWSWLTANFIYILGYAIFLHIPLGVAWALYEWKEFSAKRLRYANEMYKNPDGTFKTVETEIGGKSINPGVLPDHYERLWNESKPEYTREFSRISSWIVFWWFHIVEYMISDLVTKICRKIMEKLGFLFQKIVDNQWR